MTIAIPVHQELSEESELLSIYQDPYALSAAPLYPRSCTAERRAYLLGLSCCTMKELTEHRSALQLAMGITG